ncbi:histone-lysine N-methyltransferase PRDM9 [Kryptolebias marmoratus]|uniref:Histone-lysine N-methyltransferase PRDM9-like n=1 Tax=Kryptolebias marmoratus TaxID=37003 RepID=A0A3Q3A496_KRYMA|nr:histone-lysine N-methyltransferase PRDM9 [Kryptolebias marmoratus]XP_017289044.1 histone-lysine N-methyltransferase PRDM9 [Kryptolebias marmoratus]
MSDKDSDVEWAETTEEVVEIEKSLSLKSSTPAVPVVVVSDVDVDPAQTSIQKLLNTVGQEQTPEDFCCEECLTLFQDQRDPYTINGPSFVLDFPTSLDVPQRALLTLPFGLMIGRSSIPGAGVGVINFGPVLSPGMHFGPFEGELITRENALTSDFSWELYQGEDQYEYIDAAKDSSSNWMRYVNFARNEEEANLLAVQYKGSILFHCCRSIGTEDELTVWPSSKMYTRFSKVWAQMLTLKLNKSEITHSASNPIFLCSNCQLSFTTEAFLLRHIQYFHTQPKASEVADEDHAPGADSVHSPASVMEVYVDSVKSKTCDDCGKVFKQIPHLRRHKLCVHSNKRPYCCPYCRRSFSQASGLIRHQLVHRKQAGKKAPNQKKILSETERAEHFAAAEAAESGEIKEINGSENPLDVDAAKTFAAEAETCQLVCLPCGNSSTDEASFKTHKATGHENLRPYVCSVCQKCFRHYHDLKRHLKSHQKRTKSREKVNVDSEDAATLPFSCAECSVSFSSVDALQEHINELHSDDVSAQTQDGTTDSVQNLPSVRPQRLKARLNVSALTKLVAPKRKAARPAPTERTLSEPDTNLVKFKWFSCNHCKQTYGNPDDLKAHKCSMKLFNCEQCGATFKKSGLLQRHEQTEHLKMKSYSCDRCDKCFSTSRRLKQHQKSNSCMKYHCTSELFSCSFCQFSFTMKSYLIKHIKRHHPVKFSLPGVSDGQMDLLEENEVEHICPDCGTNCANLKDFKSHACIRKLEVLYLCTDCGKSFTNKYGLKLHQRVHTGEKPYTCPHCGKSFSYNGQLSVHLRTHTGEKPYLCTHCGESFRQSGDLKRHERKHTGVRPHRCPECNKSFSRPQSLKAHQMLHLGQRMFKCSQCGKSFSRNYHLRRHHQKVHM